MAGGTGGAGRAAAILGGGVIEQTAVLHPVRNHALQRRALDAQLAAQLTHVDGDVCCFNRVQNFF